MYLRMFLYHIPNIKRFSNKIGERNKYVSEILRIYNNTSFSLRCDTFAKTTL